MLLNLNQSDFPLNGSHSELGSSNSSKVLHIYQALGGELMRMLETVGRSVEGNPFIPVGEV